MALSPSIPIEATSRLFIREIKMPRYDVNIAIRTWVNVEVVAPTEEKAKEKALKKTKDIINTGIFNWVDGRVESMGALNLSLLKKIPS